MNLSEILNHLGENRADYFNAVAPPIIQTSNFVFDDLIQFREAIQDEMTSSIYTRGNNPTIAILRKKLAALEQAEDAIWKELEILKNEKISERELEKLKNKIESSLAFSEVNVLNKAINLAFFELLGDANLINSEAIAYQNVTTDDIQRVAREIFSKENCSELYYRATKIDG